MELSKQKRILFVPDCINGLDSGAQSARATLRYLCSLGHTVAVYTKDALVAVQDEVKNDAAALYAVPTAMRWYEFISAPKLRRHFISVVDEFQPNYVFFVGSIQKPAPLAKAARRRSIKTVYLFYINDFFCQRVYAGLADGPCFRCNSGWQMPALAKGCVSLRRMPVWIKGALVRYTLGREIRSSHRVLGYGDEQLKTCHRFGVPKERLARIGFQFDPRELLTIETRDGGYFALTGQPIVQKGWHLLSSIISRLQSTAKFMVSFHDQDTADRAVEKYGLRQFVDSGRIEIVTNLSERLRYLDFIASSRGVVLPSFYPTTGEFVLQESMFLGKPVHVFDVGVHKDVLVDRKNAMVSTLGDVADYASKIDEVEANISLRMSIGEEAKRSALHFYSNEQIELLDKVFI